MSDYTPTTDEVREVYSQMLVHYPVFVKDGGSAAFDRWLAAHDEEVLEAAVQRVKVEVAFWLHECIGWMGEGSCDTCSHANAAIAAARGEASNGG